MVYTSEQLKMINRVFPIEFIEDEFRLEGDLTLKRLYKRLNVLSDNDLKNTYYLIHIKYRQEFDDDSNEYLFKIYKMLKDICAERNINLRRYLDGIKLAKKTVDFYCLLICIASVLFLKNFVWLHIVFAAIGITILLNWDKVALFVAKKLKKKVLHVQQFSELPKMFTIASITCMILYLRNFDSVLYLFVAYVALLFLHYGTYKYLERDVYPELDSMKKKILCRGYEIVMALLILWSIYNPTLDFIGEKFNTKSIKYIEGICTEVKDLPFGYKEILVDGIKVRISSAKHDVEVGDYYRIEYGTHTKAITYVSRKDVLGRFKTDKTNDSIEIENYLNELENNEK